jgi:transcriptional regulator with XRE-family HTH domain
MGDYDLLPQQLQAARALLGWSQFDLAKQAGVARATVQRVERGRMTYRRSIVAMRYAMELAGVDFLPDSAAGGQGVRLKKSDRRDTSDGLSMA